MRHCVLALLAACGSAASPSNGGAPSVAADEVATPTEQAAAAPPTQAVSQGVRVSPPSFPATCDSIAEDIEKISRVYPQLINFRAVDQRDCAISYGHKTHKATTRGGWSSGVPHPDPDGIWFYIGIYDPNGPAASLQLHTQPVVANWWLGSRKVMFLILEGKQTKRAAGELMKILERYGMQTR